MKRGVCRSKMEILLDHMLIFSLYNILLVVTLACKAQICGIRFGKQGTVTGGVGRCMCRR